MVRTKPFLARFPLLRKTWIGCVNAFDLRLWYFYPMHRAYCRKKFNVQSSFAAEAEIYFNGSRVHPIYPFTCFLALPAPNHTGPQRIKLPVMFILPLNHHGASYYHTSSTLCYPSEDFCHLSSCLCSFDPGRPFCRARTSQSQVDTSQRFFYPHGIIINVFFLTRG